jgi:hypothetical protein
LEPFTTLGCTARAVAVPQQGMLALDIEPAPLSAIVSTLRRDVADERWEYRARRGTSDRLPRKSRTLRFGQSQLDRDESSARSKVRRRRES